MDLMSSPRAVRLVRALVNELIKHETLGGADVRRVLREADRLQIGDKRDLTGVMVSGRRRPFG